jgi:radical SAM superfamily enzyme YgiQ (UPF0313 family)
MNILLISPEVNFTTNNELLNKYWFNSTDTAPYRELWAGVGTSLLTIAALTPPDSTVEFIDENVKKIDFKKKFDLIAISAMTQQITRGYEIADCFRKLGIPVIFGGIHPTLVPEEVKAHADCVVIGEAENIWADVLNDFECKKLKPFYKSLGEVDLSQSPIPKYSLLEKNIYKLVNIQTSRGCPHDCDYCSASKIFGKKYRRKSTAQILKEIECAISHLGNVKIVFSDDNFLVDRKLSKNLLKELIPLNIKWHAQSDISIAEDEELLILAKQSGCTYLFIGLESVNPENLKCIDTKNWKYSKSTNYAEYIKIIQSFGIGVMGSFIVGLDSDDVTVFSKLEKFIIDNNLWAASITIMTPFPGTRLRERLESQNRIIDSNWKNHTGYNINFLPKNISKEDIQTGIVDLYQKINSKEVYLKKLEHFKQIQSSLIKKGLI